MIRALIGRFVRHCVEMSKQADHDRVMRGVDIGKLSDRQLSDLLHGRVLDFSREPSPARRTGS